MISTNYVTPDGGLIIRLLSPIPCKRFESLAGDCNWAWYPYIGLITRETLPPLATQRVNLKGGPNWFGTANGRQYHWVYTAVPTLQQIVDNYCDDFRHVRNHSYRDVYELWDGGYIAVWNAGLKPVHESDNAYTRQAWEKVIWRQIDVKELPTPAPQKKFVLPVPAKPRTSKPIQDQWLQSRHLYLADQLPKINTPVRVDNDGFVYTRIGRVFTLREYWQKDYVGEKVAYVYYRFARPYERAKLGLTPQKW